MPLEINDVQARALWIEGPHTGRLQPAALRSPEAGEARIVTAWSAISRGTERLVFEGRVPPSEKDRMRAPFQEGAFSFPIKYGYCAVGWVDDGPDEWMGKTVFCLHPHQDRFVAPLEFLHVIPDTVPPRRAALAANMETALNGIWDSGVGAGDRIVIVGAGVVGLLIAALAARLPGAEVTVIDAEPSRASVAEAFGARFVPAGAFDARQHAADVVFHASASQEGLAQALECAALEATVVEMSWFGDKTIAAPLGRGFHANRLRLISSQVGQVAPSRRPRWSFARRLDKAITLLADDRLDALITEEIAFEDLPQALPRIFETGAPGLATLVRY